MNNKYFTEESQEVYEQGTSRFCSNTNPNGSELLAGLSNSSFFNEATWRFLQKYSRP